MQSSFALVLIAVAGCGGSYTLDEVEGIEVARAEFTAHGIGTGSTRPMGPLMLDEVAVAFTVDGWSLADQLGFEYIAEDDPDFAEAVTDLGALGETPRLQAAVDTWLESEPGSHVLILRTWGHETLELAQDQLRRHVDEWLTAQGR